MAKNRFSTPKSKRTAKVAAEHQARKNAAGLCAHDLLASNHPLHPALVEFCGDHPPTRRKARAFLRANPTYRNGYAVKVAA